MTREGKRRRYEADSSSTVEDSVEEEEEEYVSNTPPVAAPPPRSLDTRNCRRVTLKDLIDAGLLAEGDEMYFKKTCEFTGILLPDGQIACGDHICPTLSTFAKYAASELGLKWSKQNGWCLVFCRSRCLFDLRKDYMDGFSEPTIPDYAGEEVEVVEVAILEERASEKGLPVFEEDEIYEESENVSSDCELSSSEHIRVAAPYYWLKYELQHSPEHIHGAPIWDDSRAPLDNEPDYFVTTEFDIRDKDFFPVTFEAGTFCC